MNAMKEEAIGGINAFLESQQKLPGEARLTLVLFDHEYIVAYDGVPIKDVPPLDKYTNSERGTFSEAPGGAARAFDAVSCVAAAYRAGEADYVQHLVKAGKKEKA